MSCREPFSHIWREKIWPEIESDYTELFNAMPQRIQEKVTKKEKKEEKKQKKERKAPDNERKEQREAGDDDDADENDPTKVASMLLQKKMKAVM